MDIRTFLRLLLVALCSTAVAKADVECLDPNAIYQKCGALCWRDCHNRENPPPCPDVCGPRLGACICKDGYVVDPYVGQECVPINSCSFDVLPPPPPPGLDAFEFFGPPPVIATRSGRSVWYNPCTSGPNEEFSIYGAAIQPTCDDILKGVIIERRADEEYVAGCVCVQGFVRNAAGICVTEAECRRHVPPWRRR